MQESKFDQYLGHELKRLAFVSGGAFKIADVKAHLGEEIKISLTEHMRRRNQPYTGTGIAIQIE